MSKACCETCPAFVPMTLAEAEKLDRHHSGGDFVDKIASYGFCHQEPKSRLTPLDHWCMQHPGNRA